MNAVIHRRQIHSLAEVGYREFETSAYVKSVLGRLGCDVMTLSSTGVAAFFDFGGATTSMIRAELDALPIKENTGLPFSATNGNMHACGHDAHAAMLLSFCETISSEKHRGVNVLAVFQPAEELTGGAQSVIASGVLEKTNVTEVYAIHLMPGLEKGKLFSRAGVIFAGSEEIDVSFSCDGGHAATTDSDAAVHAARFLLSVKDKLGAIGARTCFGIIRAGAARNISAPSAEIYGTLRYFSDEEREGAERIVRELASGEGCACRAALRAYAPPVKNSRELFIKSGAEDLGAPIACADDFALYGGEKIKSLYLLLGTGNTAALHSDRFDFDESVMEAGVRLYARMTKH